MLSLDQDTIVAVATAPGMGGIGVVRLSGSNAVAIADQIVVLEAGLGALAPKQLQLTQFHDRHGEALDQGLVVRFASPASFTGEDVVEFQGHGGPMVLGEIVQTCLSFGARLARPGEFSERGFLNGKMDLAQAEAVADLIASSSAAAARSALRSLQGEFSRQVNMVAQGLLELRLFVEAVLDFPEEEDVDRGSEFGLTERLSAISEGLEQLTVSTRVAVTLNEGVTVALLGLPNAGKSSLLNAMSGEDRAIVTDIPGTTRDLLPVDVVLDGLPIRLVDTAGIRETNDPIEREGVKRALLQTSKADVVLLLQEYSEQEYSEQEYSQLDGAASRPTLSQYKILNEHSFGKFFDEYQAAKPESERLIEVYTKADLGRVEGSSPELVHDRSIGPELAVVTSAKTGHGLTELVLAIKQKVGLGADVGANFTARQRHLEALDSARLRVQAAQTLAAELDDGGVLLAEELRAAHECLGQIVGRVTPDDLLGEIFASFCIGK